MPLGMEMAQDIRVMIAEAFFLNKLNMPQRGPAMTAYEVSQRVQEYIRNALPLFAPMEEDYNGQLCDRTFQVLQRNGAFGSPYDLPKGLRGEDIQFRFESPLHDALEAEYAQIFIESKTLIQEAAPLDPLAPKMLNARVGLRDALRGIGTPARWLASETEMIQYEVEAQQQKAIEALKAQVAEGAAIAEQVGVAGKALNEAEAAGSQVLAQ